MNNSGNPDIVLVQAPGWGVNTPPLGIASLSAYLRARDFKVMPIDLNIELYNTNSKRHKEGWMLDVHGYWTNQVAVDNFIGDNKGVLERYVEKIARTSARVVGFSIFVSSYLVSCYLARETKKRSPDKIVIFGGAHAGPFMAGYSIIENNPEVDIVVLGEGEETLLELMHTLKHGGTITQCAGILYRQGGKAVKTADRPPIKELDTLPFPDFTDFDLSKYKEPNKLPIISSRSCVNRCIYCNDRPFWGKYRFRSGSSMFEEVKHQTKKYPRVNYFEFADCLVNGNVRELEIFSELIIASGIKIRWAAQAIIRKEMRYDLLKKLKESGCICLAYGLETVAPSVLENIGKNASKAVDLDKLVLEHKESGLGCVFNFMFGLPGETDQDAEENINFIRRNAKNIGGVNPSPGFCLIGQGTLAYENPDKYGVDLTQGHYYWKSVDGSNTFLKRLERFEKFIAAVHELGIPSVYSFPKLENRNTVIADYYFTVGEYENAIPYYLEAIQHDQPNPSNAERLRACYDHVGHAPAASSVGRLERDKRTADEPAAPGGSPTEGGESTVVIAPVNFSDENWENGVARSWSTAFFVLNSEEMQTTLAVGRKAKLADCSTRTIVSTEINNGSLLVFLDGASLDGAVVGYPNTIEIIMKNDAVSVWEDRYAKGGTACTEQCLECDPINYTEHRFLYKHSIAQLLTGSPEGDPQTRIASKFLVPPAQKVLAIGSGMAFSEEWLVKCGYAKNILAFENSSVAVEKARARLKAAGLADKITMVCRDVLKENLPSGSFDVVFVQAAIHHFDQIEKMFALFHRVLKPNGLLIFDEYVGPDRMQYEPIVQTILDEIDDCLADQYRYDTLRKETRKGVPRATIENMVNMDPSEGVHASMILPLTYKWFDVIHRDDYAGAIMRPFWVGILPNFDFSDPKDQSIARLIILLDHLLTRHGIIPNYHTKVVPRRRENPRSDLTTEEKARINYSGWPGLRE